MRYKGYELKLNKGSLGLLFFDLTFFLFAFVGINTDAFNAKLKVFFIPGDKNIYHITLCLFVIVIVVLLEQGRIRLDAVTILLFAKMVFDYFSSYVLNGVSFAENWTRWFQTDMGFIFYFIAINLDIKPKDLVKRFQIFVTIIGLQVIWTFFVNTNQGLASFVLKNSMRIPFALSNVIAGVLVAGVVCVLLEKEKSRAIKIIQCIFYMIALFLTYSRGGIVLLDFIVLWSIKQSLKIKKKLRWYVLWGIVNISAILVVFFVMPELQTLIIGVKASAATLNDLSTNRVDLLAYAFDEFCKNPLFGRGVYYDKNVFVGSTGIHNIFMELLALSGIVGTVLYMSAVIKSVRKSNILQISKIDHYQIVLFGIVFSFFLNSMFEVVYFNYIFDALFWSFMGILVSNSYQTSYLLE